MAFLLATTSLPAVYRPNGYARTTTAGMPHARAKSLGHGLKNRDSINLNLNPGFESVNPASLISAQFKQFKLCFNSFIIYCFKLIELANLYRGRWWWWSKVIFVLNQILSCVEVSLSWGCDKN